MSDPVANVGTGRVDHGAEQDENAAIFDTDRSTAMNDAIDSMLTGPGETLVQLDDSPYFPAALGEARSEHHAAVPYFRREVAELVAIWLNATGSDDENATRAEWYGDALVIVEGPGEHTAGYTPEVIRPDEHGRYQLVPGWLWIDEEPTADVVAELDDHALTTLRSLAYDGNGCTPDERRARLEYMAGGQHADDESRARVHRAADELERRRAADAAGTRKSVRCRDCEGTYRGLEGNHAQQEPVRYCS